MAKVLAMSHFLHSSPEMDLPAQDGQTLGSRRHWQSPKSHEQPFPADEVDGRCPSHCPYEHDG